MSNGVHIYAWMHMDTLNKKPRKAYEEIIGKISLEWVEKWPKSLNAN